MIPVIWLLNQGIIFLRVFFSQETGDAHSIKFETIFLNITFAI